MEAVVLIIESLEEPDVFPLLQELRPNLDLERARNIFDEAKKNDQYTLIGTFDGKNIMGLAGFRQLTDFLHGTHLYVDDLVVSENYRSKGIGAKLLQYIEEYSVTNGFQGIRLSTGLHNVDGMRFYERENWKMTAGVFKKGFNF